MLRQVSAPQPVSYGSQQTDLGITSIAKSCSCNLSRRPAAPRRQPCATATPDRRDFSAVNGSIKSLRRRPPPSATTEPALSAFRLPGQPNDCQVGLSSLIGSYLCPDRRGQRLANLAIWRASIAIATASASAGLDQQALARLGPPPSGSDGVGALAGASSVADAARGAPYRTDAGGGQPAIQRGTEADRRHAACDPGQPQVEARGSHRPSDRNPDSRRSRVRFGQPPTGHC